MKPIRGVVNLGLVLGVFLVLIILGGSAEYFITRPSQQVIKTTGIQSATEVASSTEIKAETQVISQTKDEALLCSGKKSGYFIRAGKIYWYDNLVEGADINTFTVMIDGLPCTSGWAKDKYHIYQAEFVVTVPDQSAFSFITNDVPYPTEGDESCVNIGSIEHPPAIILGADPATFAGITDKRGKLTGYASDGKSVYYLGVQIQGADASTFQPVSNSCDYWYATAKDAHAVYYSDYSTVRGADGPETRIITGADPKTFIAVVGQQGIDTQDANHTYFKGAMVK
jgi:predicted transcriptional regulator